MVFLGVDNLEILEKEKNKLEIKGNEVVCFREPDIDNEMTAFALVSEKRILNKLKLL